jgi:hypothetical protein
MPPLRPTAKPSAILSQVAKPGGFFYYLQQQF